MTGVMLVCPRLALADMTAIIDLAGRLSHNDPVPDPLVSAALGAIYMKRLAILLMVVGLMGAACSTGATVAPVPTAAPTAAAPAAPPAVTPDVPFKPYPAELAPASADKTKQITLEIKDVNLEVAPGVVMKAWTFNGSVPGPALHVRQGDTIQFTLVNHGSMQHSIDFHAAQTAWDKNYQAVNPGESFSFTWTANVPGVFMYHCGTPPVMFHIANGMYGAIIVDPAEPLPPAKEYALVQSELYLTQGADGYYSTDGAKANAVTPSYVVFNGYANQYSAAPLTADPGQLIRLWMVNAGPTTFSAFHVIGALFQNTYADGNPANKQFGNQTVTIPPGGGYMVELAMPDAGLYPFVTHSFAYTGLGALGLIDIGNVPMPNMPVSH
jgi:nitrite reductase (NO-forming)